MVVRGMSFSKSNVSLPDLDRGAYAYSVYIICRTQDCSLTETPIIETGAAAQPRNIGNLRRGNLDAFDPAKLGPITSIITYTAQPGEASESFIFSGVYTLPFSVPTPVPITPISSNLASRLSAQSVSMVVSFAFSYLMLEIQ